MDRDPSPSSSDEDDDLETLVPQNHTKPPSPFDIIGRATSAAAAVVSGGGGGCDGRFWWSRRYLLLAICLPLLLILLFFSLDLSRLFSGISNIRLPSAAGAGSGAAAATMRESELRALFLLRNQQLGLLKLWNRTHINAHAGSSIAAPPSPALTMVPFDEFRSALLEQIEINREIEKALLSSHRSGRSNATSESASDGNVGFDFLNSVCQKVEKPAGRRTVEWRPKKDRYLFAICLSGQMSNHLICLKKHMFFAALLDRILVIPSHHLDYQYDRVLDVEHINECIGRKVVMSFEEFAEMRKKKLSIDRFKCYMASPPCFLDEEHEKRLKHLGISIEGKIEAAWPEDAKLKEPKKRVVEDIMPKFSSDAEVLAIGDMFYADVEEEWMMQPGGPLAHKCKTLIQPSKLVVLTAQRFVQTFLGSNFVALHFRRHGFLKFCNAKKESCFFPIPQAAECILRVVERSNAPVIYLSTDAAESETNLLQSLVVLNNKPVPLVKRPERDSAEKWDALLHRHHIDGDNQVEAMLDKTICALSNVFIGSPGSTFTEDILRLRRDWESASQCDQYLCQGELPNYIAGPE